MGNPLEYYIGFGRYHLYHLMVAQWIVLPEIVNLVGMSLIGAIPRLRYSGSSNESMEGKELLCVLFQNESNVTMDLMFRSAAVEVGLRYHIGF